MSDEDHHWDVKQVYEYIMYIASQKLWPNPHAMVLDGFGVQFAYVHLDLNEAFKLDHEGSNSSYNV